MSQAEESTEKTRKKLIELFKENDFSLELDATGVKIYKSKKNSDHIILGEKEVTFTTPLFRDVLTYPQADSVFSSYFSDPPRQPPSTLERYFELLKKSTSYISSLPSIIYKSAA